MSLSVSLAQTVISGSVKNSKGEPLVVNMTVQAKGNVMIAGFSVTDAKGNYSLNYRGTADSLVITVSGMNIGKHNKIVANHSEKVDFVIEEKALELKEVTVVAPKITLKGDTLNYSVSAFSDQNDLVIGDVLKKLPGIEVTSDGTIKYNNKDINKFYVENMDLLLGRYGIATNNIPAKDVATVQVMENHQPIKALRDRVFSDQAAINLKLKDSAKGTLSLTGLAGTGYRPFLWNAELVSMYFAKGKQNITTYKGNNSGDDVAGEFRTHYDYERVYMNPNSLLSVQSPAAPPVPSKRYLYNRSHAATTNQLFKLGEETELTVNALYYDDRIEKEGYSYYEQYLPGDSILAIEERIQSLSKIHNAELALRLKKNAANYYLNNAFNLNGNWNSDNGLSSTSSNEADVDETIIQSLNKPFFSIDNTLNIVKNIKDNSYNLYFSAGYGHKPHILKVNPVSYFGDDRLASLSQRVLSKDFATVLRTSYGLKINQFNLDYALWGRADIQNMETELLGKDSNGYIIVVDDSLENNLGYNIWQTGINQSYSFDNGTLKARIQLPVIYYLLTIDDRIPERTGKHNKLIVNPAFSVNYQLKPELTLSAGANFRQSYGDMNLTYTGYIMHNYRSLLRNSIDYLFETRSGEGNLLFAYRDVFKYLFINGGLSYNRSWRNLLYGYNYQGIMRVRTVIDHPTQSEGYGVNINGSKGLDFWSATVRASGGYNISTSELLVQNEILNYHSQGYNANGSINMNPASFMGFNYSLSWFQNKSYTVERPESFPAIKVISQNMKISIFPFKTLTVNFGLEHQYNSAANVRYTYFANGSVKYKYKQLDLELIVNNLLNAKQYVSASYSDISTYYYSYNLRPASVLLKARFKLK